LLAVDSLEGTIIEKRIKEVVARGHKESILYNLKPLVPYKSETMFDDELKRYMDDHL
jgi:hypothetical protein